MGGGRGGKRRLKTSREKEAGDNRVKIEIQPMLDVGEGERAEGEGFGRGEREVQLVATSSKRCAVRCTQGRGFPFRPIGSASECAHLRGLAWLFHLQTPCRDVMFRYDGTR